MKAKDQVFVKYEDDSGQKYYCTVNVVANKDDVPEWDLDNCVKASKKKRHSKKINIVDRSK